MTSVDKAAMVWLSAIVAVGAGFAMSGGSALDTAAPATTPPPPQESITTPGEPSAIMVTKTKIPGFERITSIQDPGMGHD